MPHEFVEWEPEPETQAAAARGGGPPGNRVGAGVLDPMDPAPSAKPSGAMAILQGILAVALLIAVIGGLLLPFMRR